MVRLHLLGRVLKLINDVLEHLPIREHPVSVEKEDKRRPAKHVQSVDSHFVIHCRWELIRVSDLVTLRAVNDEVGQEGDWEELRKCKAIHHRDEGNVKNAGELEVNDIVRAGVDLLVGIDLRCLGFIDTLLLGLAATATVVHGLE